MYTHQQKQQTTDIIQKKTSEIHENLPEDLKNNYESKTGFSLSNIQIHYNSSKPVQLQAQAYTQDSQIHLAPNQEEHLPYEAWHAVQQKQGRVQPALQLKNMNINNEELEIETDKMTNNVVIQRKAWVSVRKLDNADRLLNRKKQSHSKGGQITPDDLKTEKDPNRWTNLNIEHHHIIFDNGNVKGLPPRHQLHGGTPGEYDIGYRSSNGKWRGPGQLFSDILGGYTKWTPPISNTPAEDRVLVQAINTIGTNGRFITYNLFLSNCQDWVTDVKKQYNFIKRRLPPKTGGVS
jgi:hypothetical protein